MQFVEESEIVEDDGSLAFSARTPNELKLSDNWLLSNKGHLKEHDLRSFRDAVFTLKDQAEMPIKVDSRNEKNSWTKIPKTFDWIVAERFGKNNESFEEINFQSAIQLHSVKRMYIGQRKFSSNVILADMFN